jgi:hypothetical protein
MLTQIRENLGEAPKQLSADSGYYSEANVIRVRDAGINDYLYPDRVKHHGD